jgi:hypothetical protein
MMGLIIVVIIVIIIINGMLEESTFEARPLSIIPLTDEEKITNYFQSCIHDFAMCL